MKSKKTLFAMLGFSILAGFITVCILPLMTAQGSDAANTDLLIRAMNSMSRQIESIKTELENEYSGNFAFMSENLDQAEVCVWDHDTQKWYTKTLSGAPGYLVESHGNICGYAQSGLKIHLAVWDKRTKKWSTIVRNAETIQIVPSDGNFGFFTSSQEAGAWTPEAGKWIDTRIPGKIAKAAGFDRPELPCKIQQTASN